VQDRTNFGNASLNTVPNVNIYAFEKWTSNACGILEYIGRSFELELEQVFYSTMICQHPSISDRCFN